MGEETDRHASSRDLDDSFSVAETRNQDARHLYEFGPDRLDRSERKLSPNNQIVELPPKAFDTLVLIQHAGLSRRSPSCRGSAPNCDRFRVIQLPKSK